MVKYCRHTYDTGHVESSILGGVDFMVLLLGRVRQKKVLFIRIYGMGVLLSTRTLGNDRKTVYLSCVCWFFYYFMLLCVLSTTI